MSPLTTDALVPDHDASTPLLIFWAHETVWCGLWAESNAFELRLVRDGTTLRLRRFDDPADAYTESLSWLSSVELDPLTAGRADTASSARRE